MSNSGLTSNSYLFMRQHIASQRLNYRHQYKHFVIYNKKKIVVCSAENEIEKPSEVIYVHFALIALEKLWIRIKDASDSGKILSVKKDLQ